LADVSALYVHRSIDYRRGRRRGANDEHRAILHAYANGDAEQALERTLDHMNQTHEAALRFLGEDTRPETAAE
jgi:DNA-binding GntR family transcriptional regulator